MKPYYADEEVTLFCADSLKVLMGFAESGAAAVITDPPYGVDFRGEAWDREIPDWLPTARAVAPIVAFTTAPVTLWDYPRPDWLLCWYRPASSSRSLLGGFNHWSPIPVYGKPHFPFDAVSLHAIKHAYPLGIGHPSPKPLALAGWLVRHCSAPGGLILDPFAGSGTTLLAAKRAGRRAIGIEIDPKYCAVAAERLRAETQGALFPEAA